jgi:transposase-like protein
MAKKGSKFNRYSPEFKIKVVEAYLSGEFGGSKKTANYFGLPSKDRVMKWVKRYKESGPQSSFVETRGRATKVDNINKGRLKKVNLDEMTKDEQIAYLKMENDILKKVQALRKH